MLKRLAKISAGVALAAMLSSAAFAEMVCNRGNRRDPEIARSAQGRSTSTRRTSCATSSKVWSMPDAEGEPHPGRRRELDGLRRRHWSTPSSSARTAVWSNGDPGHRRRFRLLLPAAGGSQRPPPHTPRCSTSSRMPRRSTPARRSRRRLGVKAIDPTDARGHAQRADALFPRDADAPGDLPGAPGLRREVSARNGSSRATSSRTAPSRSPRSSRTITSRS